MDATIKLQKSERGATVEFETEDRTLEVYFALSPSDGSTFVDFEYGDFVYHKNMMFQHLDDVLIAVAKGVLSLYQEDLQTRISTVNDMLMGNLIK